MRKTLYYLPALLLLSVIFIVEEGWMKIALITLLAISMLIAKYKRKQLDSNEIEIDERVQRNIYIYSFGFITIMNALLLCYFVLVSQFDMQTWLINDHIILYLALSIAVPYYIIPSIAKKL